MDAHLSLDRRARSDLRLPIERKDVAKSAVALDDAAPLKSTPSFAILLLARGASTALPS
jgi:hypothetical protein